MSYKYNPLIPHNLEKIPKASEIKSNGNSNVQDDLDDINERLEDLPYVPQLTSLEPFPIALGRIFQWQGEDDETVQVTDLDGDTTYIKHGYFYKKTNSEDGIIIEHGTPYLTINENITYNNEILVKAGTYYKKPNGLSFRNGPSSKDGYKFLVIGINSLIVKNNIVHKVISIEDTTDFSLTYKTYTLDNGETFISQGQGLEAPYQWVEFINDDLDSIFLGEQSVFNPQVAGSGAYLNIAINENNLVFSGWHNIQGTRDEHIISQPALIRMNTQPRGETLNSQQSDYNQTDTSQPDYIKNKPLPYTLEKVTDFTYKMFVGELDYDNAQEYFENSADDINVGACSSVRKGNFYGRNYDWLYDNSIDFIVETPNRLGRYATIGIGGFSAKLTQNFVDSKEYSELYKIVPFKIVDGINEKGLVCNINVVPQENGTTSGTTPLISTKKTLCNIMLPRFILDNFATAQEAVNYIRDYVSVYNYTTLSELYHYDLHIMIGDATKTFLIEFINNATVVTDITEKAFMTNFHLNGVTFNNDGSIPTPYSDEGNVTDCGITSHGAGLERYNIINSAYANLSTKTAMQTLMNNLKYTNAYDNVTDANKWLSEFVGNYDTLGNITVDSSLTDLNSVYAEARSLYLNRDRDTGLTWHTVHSTVYDIENKQVTLIFQENGEEYKFELAKSSAVNDYNLLINKPLIVSSTDTTEISIPVDRYYYGQEDNAPIHKYKKDEIISFYVKYMIYDRNQSKYIEYISPSYSTSSNFEIDLIEDDPYSSMIVSVTDDYITLTGTDFKELLITVSNNSKLLLSDNIESLLYRNIGNESVKIQVQDLTFTKVWESKYRVFDPNTYYFYTRWLSSEVDELINTKFSITDNYKDGSILLYSGDNNENFKKGTYYKKELLPNYKDYFVCLRYSRFSDDDCKFRKFLGYCYIKFPSNDLINEFINSAPSFINDNERVDGFEIIDLNGNPINDSDYGYYFSGGTGQYGCMYGIVSSKYAYVPLNINNYLLDDIPYNERSFIYTPITNEESIVTNEYQYITIYPEIMDTTDDGSVELYSDELVKFIDNFTNYDDLNSIDELLSNVIEFKYKNLDGDDLVGYAEFSNSSSIIHRALSYDYGAFLENFYSITDAIAIAIVGEIKYKSDSLFEFNLNGYYRNSSNNRTEFNLLDSWDGSSPIILKIRLKTPKLVVNETITSAIIDDNSVSQSKTWSSEKISMSLSNTNEMTIEKFKTKYSDITDVTIENLLNDEIPVEILDQYWDDYFSIDEDEYEMYILLNDDILLKYINYFDTFDSETGNSIEGLIFKLVNKIGGYESYEYVLVLLDYDYDRIGYYSVDNSININSIPNYLFSLSDLYYEDIYKNSISVVENDLSLLKDRELFQYCHIEGIEHDAQGYSAVFMSHIEGISNSFGNWSGLTEDQEHFIEYSHVEGVDNSIGCGSGIHVEGKNNFLGSADSSHIEGNDNYVPFSITSHIEGGRADMELQLIKVNNTLVSYIYLPLNYSFELKNYDGIYTISNITWDEYEGYYILTLLYNNQEFIFEGSELDQASDNVFYARPLNNDPVSGYLNSVSSILSHVEGTGNICTGIAQHIEGKYCIHDAYNKYSHIVGNGTNINHRSNSHTLDWQGNAWFQGNVTSNNIPNPPSSDGTYVLTCTVTNGIPTYSWTLKN